MSSLGAEGGLIRCLICSRPLKKGDPYPLCKRVICKKAYDKEGVWSEGSGSGSIVPSKGSVSARTSKGPGISIGTSQELRTSQKQKTIKKQKIVESPEEPDRVEEENKILEEKIEEVKKRLEKLPKLVLTGSGSVYRFGLTKMALLENSAKQLGRVLREYTGKDFKFIAGEEHCWFETKPGKEASNVVIAVWDALSKIADNQSISGDHAGATLIKKIANNVKNCIYSEERKGRFVKKPVKS